MKDVSIFNIDFLENELSIFQARVC